MAAIAMTVGALENARYWPMLTSTYPVGSAGALCQCHLSLAGIPRPVGESPEFRTQSGIESFAHNVSYRMPAPPGYGTAETVMSSGGVAYLITPFNLNPTDPLTYSTDAPTMTNGKPQADNQAGRRFYDIDASARFLDGEGQRRNFVSFFSEATMPASYVDVDFEAPPISSGWHPYADGEACSTFEMQRCAIDNVNAVIANNRNIVTVVCRVDVTEPKT
jgi:hypothetical protein